jgi:hypothetical protein
LGLLLALLLAGQSGCCCLSCLDFGHGPAGPLWTRTWCGPQCGEIFWNEWFSCPPMCHDCCDDCGDFTCSDNPYVLAGPTEAQYGPIYDDGSRSAGSKPYAAPHHAPGPQPTPAKPQAVEEPPVAPPVEELPSMEPTTSLGSGRYEQTVSYDAPVDSSRPPRTVRKQRRPGN